MKSISLAVPRTALRTVSCGLLAALCAVSAAGRGTAQQEQRPPAAQQQRQGGSPLVAQAESLISAGKLDPAIETLLAAARLAPEDPQVSFLLGQAYYRKGDSQRAVEHLTKSVARLPESAPQLRQAVQMLARSHFVMGHVKEAVPYFERLARWSPDALDTAYALGVGYVLTREPVKARQTFARMFGLAPDSPAAHLVNAQMMVRQQVEELAEEELRRALELDPRLPQANFLLGELAIYRADIERGIALLQKEIALNPANGMAYYRLGEALTRRLKWDEAVAPLQKSIWLNPYFSGPYVVLGKVYLKKGDLAGAEGVLRRAVQMDPNNYSGHHLLAQVLQQADRMEEARREFETAERLRANAERDK